MGRSNFGAIALVVAMATGVLATGAKTANPSAATPAPFRAGPDGSVVHRSTGIVFPRAYGGFVRVSTQALDERGESAVAIFERGTGEHRSVARITLVQIDDM